MWVEGSYKVVVVCTVLLLVLVLLQCDARDVSNNFDVHNYLYKSLPFTVMFNGTSGGGWNSGPWKNLSTGLDIGESTQGLLVAFPSNRSFTFDQDEVFHFLSLIVVEQGSSVTMHGNIFNDEKCRPVRYFSCMPRIITVLNDAELVLDNVKYKGIDNVDSKRKSIITVGSLNPFFQNTPTATGSKLTMRNFHSDYGSWQAVQVGVVSIENKDDVSKIYNTSGTMTVNNLYQDFDVDLIIMVGVRMSDVSGVSVGEVTIDTSTTARKYQIGSIQSSWMPSCETYRHAVGTLNISGDMNFPSTTTLDGDMNSFDRMIEIGSSNRCVLPSYCMDSIEELVLQRPWCKSHGTVNVGGSVYGTNSVTVGEARTIIQTKQELLQKELVISRGSMTINGNMEGIPYILSELKVGVGHYGITVGSVNVNGAISGFNNVRVGTCYGNQPSSSTYSTDLSGTLTIGGALLSAKYIHRYNDAEDEERSHSDLIIGAFDESCMKDSKVMGTVVVGGDVKIFDLVVVGGIIPEHENALVTKEEENYISAQGRLVMGNGSSLISDAIKLGPGGTLECTLMSQKDRCSIITNQLVASEGSALNIMIPKSAEAGMYIVHVLRAVNMKKRLMTFRGILSFSVVFEEFSELAWSTQLELDTKNVTYKKTYDIEDAPGEVNFLYNAATGDAILTFTIPEKIVLTSAPSAAATTAPTTVGEDNAPFATNSPTVVLKKGLSTLESVLIALVIVLVCILLSWMIYWFLFIKKFSMGDGMCAENNIKKETPAV